MYTCPSCGANLDSMSERCDCTKMPCVAAKLRRAGERKVRFNITPRRAKRQADRIKKNWKEWEQS
jgi:predicted alpha/beta-hydrolase family hydrolase